MMVLLLSIAYTVEAHLKNHFKARMIPFKRLNDIRKLKQLEQSTSNQQQQQQQQQHMQHQQQQQQQHQPQQRGSVLAKIEYENEKPVQQSFPPRIQTIKRNPVIVRDHGHHHGGYAPVTSTTQVIQNQSGTINRYVTTKPVTSVHQKIVSSGEHHNISQYHFSCSGESRNFINVGAPISIGEKIKVERGGPNWVMKKTGQQQQQATGPAPMQGSSSSSAQVFVS